MSNPPELGIVCKNCGSEVSAYVTECPYCGQRLRKRAPKLERHGDEVSAKRPWRSKLPGLGRPSMPSVSFEGGRSYVTIAAIALSAVLVIVDRAAGGSLDVLDLGALAGPFDTEPWRYLTAPFVYADLGYLFAVGVALAIFGSAIERRLGSPAMLTLMLACGGLGMLAADGIEQAAGDGVFLAAGGNAAALGMLAAWYVLDRAGRKAADPYVSAESISGAGGSANFMYESDADLIGALVVAAVLLALPAVEDWANVWAGLAGALGGAGAGWISSRRKTPI